MKIPVFLFIFIGCGSAVFAQQTPVVKRVMLAWDASFSMESRIPENDFKFLENYFKRNPEVSINLLVFSNEVRENLEYSITAGNWDLLKEKLLDTPYDGATNYNSIESRLSLEHMELLLFTDGGHCYGPELPLFGVKTLVVNSSPFRDQMDLNALLVKNQARLFDYGRPIFQTDVPEASPPQVGLKHSPEMAAADSLTQGIRLKEVVVSKEKKSAAASKQIYTSRGKVDKDRVGVAVQSIDENDISAIHTNVAQSVQNRFSGVKLGGSDDLSKVTMRTNNSMLLNNYGLVIVDGVPQQQSSSASGTSGSANFSFLDPSSIADITVLKGMAATLQYGTAGANGVILITTKSSMPGKGPTATASDRALRQDNIYTEPLSETLEAHSPSYLLAYSGIKDVKAAYALYLEQRKEFMTVPAYYIDLFQHFLPIDESIAQRILSNLAELNPKNIPGLRILAYTYDARGQSKEALEVYRRIFYLDDQSGQSKLDLALAFEANGKYVKAYEQLTALLYPSATEADYGELEKPAGNSLRNLFRDGSGLLPGAADKKYMNKVQYDARILVMWSKNNAQFELKFINPERRFFKWEHSPLADVQRFNSDVRNDINTEEFHLIDAQKGDWHIQVHKGTPTGVEPVYLKFLIYYDVGKPGQRMEIRSVALENSTEKPQLLRIKV